MTLATGTVLIDRYRIVRLLGQGGFGAVYRAWDLHLNAPFALKENLEASPEATRQFAREAQILANLHHPNLPRVTDHFSLPDQGQYLVMEYVEGEDLEEMRCKSACQPAGSLPEAQVLTWISQILDALEYLHQQNPPIIHRDIKPANIRITPQGKAILVDFGIAKIFNPVLKTTVGARAITPGYSPLEQYGQGVTDARTDIYALGATLYVLLTGQTPPESTTRAWKDPLIPLEQLNPGLSQTTCFTIRKAMQTDPAGRWQNSAEMRLALRSAMRGSLPVSITEDSSPSKVKESSLAAQDVVLVAPMKPLPETTPMEAVGRVPVTPQRKVAPPKGSAPTRKPRLGWILAGGAVVLVLACAAIICYLNSVGSKLLESTRTVNSLPTSTSSYGVIPSPAPLESGQRLRIGLLAPLSGQVPTFGISTKEGVEMAVKEWNDKGGVLGKKIELVVGDSQCLADPAVNAANKLIDQEGVKYIVGEVCSNASIPISEIVNQKKVVQISPSSTNAGVTVDKDGKVKPFTFRACFIDPYQGAAMAKFAIQRGYKTAFIMVDPDNAYVTGLADAFEITFTDLGGRIVGREPHSSQITDFSATLEKVADSQADILYIADYYNIVNLVGAQAKARGINAVMMGGDGWDSPDLDVKVAEGGFYSNHYDPGDTRPIVQDWLQRYGAQFKDNAGKPKVPDAIATLAYDATNMLLAAIQQAGVDDTSKVAETLARINWDGVTGAITFDGFHNPIKPVVILNVRNGQKVYSATIRP